MSTKHTGWWLAKSLFWWFLTFWPTVVKTVLQNIEENSVWHLKGLWSVSAYPVHVTDENTVIYISGAICPNRPVYSMLGTGSGADARPRSNQVRVSGPACLFPPHGLLWNFCVCLPHGLHMVPASERVRCLSTQCPASSHPRSNSGRPRV